MADGGDLDALIAQAQEGDVRAFEALVADHLPQVRRFARAFAPSDSDADDVAQDALIKVYKSLRSFRYQSAFSSWLYSVVRNVCLDSARSRRGRESAREEPLQPQHLEHLRGAAPPDESIEREEERQRLWRALREVPVEFRSALVLFDIEGCTYDEVAAIERVPIGTVKSRLSRGRSHLRLLLEERELPAVEETEKPGTQPAIPPSHFPRSGS